MIGLAAIVIGEVLFGWFRNFALKLAAAVIGSVVYFVIRAVVLELGMNPNYMKLLSALIVALALCVPGGPPINGKPTGPTRKEENSNAEADQCEQDLQ